MSNQNDLDDQLYILLASMKEYREAIADDNKRLEAFYKEVASGVLNKTEKHLKRQSEANRRTQQQYSRIKQCNQST